MTDLRDAARQALNSLRGYRREINCEQPCDAERALEAALAEEALQRLTDANQEIEAVLEQELAALIAAAERERACRIVTGLCISDNNAHEINTKIREGNP